MKPDIKSDIKPNVKSDIQQFITTPLKIGNRVIPGRLILAPMAGLTHVAYRELLDGYGGCGLLFTEMCSARSVPHENRYVSPVFRWRDEELPRLVCQIFGSDPESMATAAKRVEAEGFFGVDLNFGCSVAAICKKNCGAALLKTPDLAVKMVRDVRKAVSIPLTVKFRTGWEDRPDFAMDLARRFEDAGADALIFHPRVAPDRRSRPPKWEYIREVKQAVSIPVFGNGEVFTLNDCEKMIETTGCDGVSLGRIAIAKPWVFSQWSNGCAVEMEIYRKNIKQMILLLSKHYEATPAIRKFKKMAVYNAALFRFGHSFLKKMSRADDFFEIESAVDAFFDESPELADRPNLNLFR
ncbi:MAG: tRNA-dihydrouridine synthase family protein [Desulfobacteraceae bacterium]|nr:tRNA-dihydrouridine synthase family protein [Desulfobacteraceae bacterium]MBC2754061.1 tRNA-dihydrouridine synthase family protein [Desulfobacteraceae bacterium]